MIAHPVSRFLIQFGATEEPPPPPDLYSVDLQPLISKQEEPQEDRQALLDAAREEGRVEGRAAAQAFFETVIANQKREHDKRLGDERIAWTDEEGSRLTLCMTEAVKELTEQLSAGVDAVLRPFIIESLRRQMIEELVADVGVLLASDETPVIEISGSADLIAVLQEKLSSAPASIEYKPDDSIDVRIVAHHTIIESQLRAWIERFDPSRE